MAGMFKLKIYIVSLNSSSMTEEHLGALFAELPQRCLVLLEDIDTSGISHSRTPVVPLEDNSPSPKTGTSQTDAKPNANGPPFNKISLSALLNCLDGVAAAEGRVLVMTTNHIEKLDKALIRPGRVDMTIKFKLADTHITRTLFKAMYGPLEGDEPAGSITDDENKDVNTLESVASNGHVGGRSAEGSANLEKSDGLNRELVEDARLKTERDQAMLEKLSHEFSAKIPCDAFSPAEIQGYLLKWKRSPELAIANAEEWVRSMEKEKKETEERKKEEEQQREKEKKETDNEKEIKNEKEKEKEETS